MAAAPELTIQKQARHSPCIGVCLIDEAMGQCGGCARTRAEIGGWIAMSEAERDDVWAALGPRLDAMAAPVRLLPWTAGEIREWVAQRMSEQRGAWLIDPGRAEAAFPNTPGSPISVELTDDTVTAITDDAAFRLRIGAKLRAFAFADGGPIVFGLPKARAAMPLHSTVTALGADDDAIDLTHTHHRFFDIGVARTNSRSCLRTADDDLIALMIANSGRAWPDVLPGVSALLQAGGAVCVVESAAARVELFASGTGPWPGSVSARMATSEEGPKLPDFALPVAAFYPAVPHGKARNRMK